MGILRSFSANRRAKAAADRQNAWNDICNEVRAFSAAAGPFSTLVVTVEPYVVGYMAAYAKVAEVLGLQFPDLYHDRNQIDGPRLVSYINPANPTGPILVRGSRGGVIVNQIIQTQVALAQARLSVGLANALAGLNAAAGLAAGAAWRGQLAADGFSTVDLFPDAPGGRPYAHAPGQPTTPLNAAWRTGVPPHRSRPAFTFLRPEAPASRSAQCGRSGRWSDGPYLSGWRLAHGRR